MFSEMNFSWSMGHFLVLLSHIPHKKSEELPLGCLFDVFTGLWLSTPTFVQKVMVMLSVLSVHWFYW